MYQIPLLLLLSFLLLSCSPEEEKTAPQPVVEKQQQLLSPPPEKGCRNCHSVSLDPAHDLQCTVCHNGNSDTELKEEAHGGLIPLPAHPDNMLTTCGACHQEQVQSTAHSLHFTLKNAVNIVRRGFGAAEDLGTLTDIPVADPPATVLDLADDLLRRRCLRCHPYNSGDRYPAVARGSGCAACHLQFYEGKLISHSFLATPGDKQCQQCHYGNWVGADYFGRYEHDMNDEYRTPYTTRDEHFRPYGVEFHQLAPDVHQQAGMICVDCHFQDQLMGNQGKALRCEDCHAKENLEKEPLPANITREKDSYTLHSRNENKEHRVPLLSHPAHALYAEKVSCQVCHAQWAFNDQGTHLLRSDIDDYEPFARLTVQGSSEIEKLLNNNLDFDADELPHGMTDKINGEFRAGIWYKGFVTRRWESVSLGRDASGRIRVLRPLLDLHLSWIDEDEGVSFDAVQADSANEGMLPYTPHTTGKAGLFYKNRIDNFLQSEKIVNN